MINGARLLTGLAAAALTVSATTACAHRVDPGRVVVKTVVVTHTPGPADASPSTSPVANVTTREPAAPTMHTLPGTCASQLSAGTIIDAVGHNVPGRTAFVVGRPDSSIGRLTYLNCQYGVSRTHGPAIEITVGLYRSAKRAAGRISSTADDFAYHGATAGRTTIGGEPATLLLGSHAKDYGPTVVLAAGQRTVAVTLRPGTAQPTSLLEELAKVALLHTA